MARRLGVDRLATTARKFGLGDKVLNILSEEKSGIVPDTKWKLDSEGDFFVSGSMVDYG